MCMHNSEHTLVSDCFKELWRAVTYETRWQAVYMQMLEQMLMACSKPRFLSKSMVTGIMVYSTRVHQHVLIVAQVTAAIPQIAG